MNGLRIIVCGGRNYRNVDRVHGVLNHLLRTDGIAEVIQGGAGGADKIAREWATAYNVPCTTIPADWDQFGKAAGPIRNSKMAEMKPDKCIVFPGSSGTADMMRKAYAAGISVHRCDDFHTP